MMDLIRINSLTGGAHSGENPTILGLVNDTRKDCQQKLYVAIEGPNYDGHQYINDAHAKGAIAALIQQSLTQKSLTQKPLDITVPSVQVADSVQAMGKIAAAWRNDFDIPVLAITGSAGKTTLKELAGAVLSQSMDGVITEGNLNNEIGVPLTLTRLNAEHEFAVIEMGMNHAGEIEYLSNMASPTVAIINNAAPAHLDDLGSVEAVAKAKAEIINGLRSDGVLIVNQDDQFCSLWKSLAGNKRVVSFGLNDSADIYASFEMTGSSSMVHVKGKYGQFSTELTITGEHNIRNALAVIAATMEMGCTVQDVKQGLSQYQSLSNRGGNHSFESALLIDDTYNANPVSMQAAFDVLALQLIQAKQNHQQVKTTIVLGSMSELGQMSAELHEQVGNSARLVADNFYCCGRNYRDYIQGFGGNALGFKNAKELVVELKKMLEKNNASNHFNLILVKGSRSENMELVVNEVLETFQLELFDDMTISKVQKENQ